MAFENPLQAALSGGQPLKQRRAGRYRTYYQEQQQDGQQPTEQPDFEQPPQPSPMTASLVPPAERQTNGYSRWQQNEQALQPDQPEQPRWNQGGGPIQQLYGGGQQSQQSQQGLSALIGQGQQKPFNPYMEANPQANTFGQDNWQAALGRPAQTPQAQPQPAQQQRPSIVNKNGQSVLIDDDGSERVLQPQELQLAQQYVSQYGQPAAAPSTAAATPAAGTQQWRGFTNQGGQWGGGNYNPDAIQTGDFTGQLEGFNLAKLDPGHEDANSIKYVFAKAASGIDVKQPGATQAVVERLRAMGVNASVENPDGEADRIIFHDTGESIDVMRGGAKVGQAGWQWIDAAYGGQPVAQQGQQAPTGNTMGAINPTTQALAGGLTTEGDPGASDYVANLIAQLRRTDPQLLQQLLGGQQQL